MAERNMPATTTPQKSHDGGVVHEAIANGQKHKRSKLSGAIIARDVNDVGSSVMNDVFIPALKDIIFNVIQTSVEMLLFGESRSPYRRSGSRSNERTGYSRMYRREADDEYDRPSRRRSRDSFMSEDVEVDGISTREKAKQIREELLGIQDEYDMVQLAEFYQLCGVEWDYPDRKWGWTDLRERDIDIFPRRGAWSINLPKPVALD